MPLVYEELRRLAHQYMRRVVRIVFIIVSYSLKKPGRESIDIQGRVMTGKFQASALTLPVNPAIAPACFSFLEDPPAQAPRSVVGDGRSQYTDLD